MRMVIFLACVFIIQGCERYNVVRSDGFINHNGHSERLLYVDMTKNSNLFKKKIVEIFSASASRVTVKDDSTIILEKVRIREIPQALNVIIKIADNFEMKNSRKTFMYTEFDFLFIDDAGHNLMDESGPREILEENVRAVIDETI